MKIKRERPQEDVEQEAIDEQFEELEEKDIPEEPDTLNNLKTVLAIVEKEYSLGKDHDYTVTAFICKGKKIGITLSNYRFDIAVTLKPEED